MLTKEQIEELLNDRGPQATIYDHDGDPYDLDLHTLANMALASLTPDKGSLTGHVEGVVHLGLCDCVPSVQADKGRLELVEEASLLMAAMIRDMDDGNMTTCKAHIALENWHRKYAALRSEGAL